MELFIGIIILSIITEGVITYVKTFFVECKIQWQMIGALILGVLVGVGYNADLLRLFKLQSTIPYLGNVLTGILISRGSNYIFDLIDKIGSYKTSK